MGDSCLQKYKNRKHIDFYFVLNNIIKGHCVNVKISLPTGLFNDNTPYTLKREACKLGVIYELKSRSDPYLTKQRKRWLLI